MLYIFAVIFVAITNFYYVGINHSVDFYYYIVLYNITIVSYGYQRKLKYIYIYIILRKQEGSISQEHLKHRGQLMN